MRGKNRGTTAFRAVFMAAVCVVTLLVTYVFAIAGPDAWSNTGFTSAGSVSVSSDYANDSTIFAGTTSGEIWKSLDAGDSTWTLMQDVGSDAIRGIVTSPNYASDQTIFVAAQDGGSRPGVWFSYDGGDTWNTDVVKQNGWSIAITEDY
ncbi:MAG TPA: hypothetical protein ENI11_06670 [Actinobacteria bacterium]|nr:hypothetical protein [Actinomycetota bacterium]